MQSTHASLDSPDTRPSRRSGDGAHCSRIVAVLSPFELEYFFPDGLNKMAAAHRLPELVLHSAPEHKSETWSWREFLEQERPDVLVGGWDMPAFPELKDGGHEGGEDIPKELWPGYVCFLTGTLRKKIPRCWIEQGLLVSNWGDSISRIVAESALMLILGALRCVAANQYNLHHNGGWKLPGRPEESLFGRRVGFHGFGRIAQALTRLLRPFDVSLRTFAPGTPESTFIEHDVYKCATIEELFSTSDVLVELAPLNADTREIVGRELLELLPEGAVFVNSGRGQVVREAELLEVAIKRRLRVALDVFDTEPLAANSPLRAHPEILLMPHQGGPTLDRCRDAGDFALRQVAAWLREETPATIITLPVWDISS